MSDFFCCPKCRKMMRVRESMRGKQARCTSCSTVTTVPLKDAPDAVDAEPVRRGSRKPTFSLEPEEAIPVPEEPAAQPTPTPDGPPCPSCGEPMHPGAVLCLQCGFDTRTGEQLHTEVERVRIGFGPDPSLLVRILIAAVFISLCVPFPFLAREDDSRIAFGVFLAVWVFTWIGLSGSFVRFFLTRDDRGRPVLSKIYCVGYIPVYTYRLRLDRFKALFYAYRRGVSDHGKIVFIFICLALLCVGVFPGLLFWWFVFWKDAYILQIGTHVDEPRETLFIGRQSCVHDYARILQGVATHLKSERG